MGEDIKSLSDLDAVSVEDTAATAMLYYDNVKCKCMTALNTVLAHQHQDQQSCLSSHWILSMKVYLNLVIVEHTRDTV